MHMKLFRPETILLVLFLVGMAFVPMASAVPNMNTSEQIELDEPLLVPQRAAILEDGYELIFSRMNFRSSSVVYFNSGNTIPAGTYTLTVTGWDSRWSYDYGWWEEGVTTVACKFAAYDNMTALRVEGQQTTPLWTIVNGTFARENSTGSAIVVLTSASRTGIIIQDDTYGDNRGSAIFVMKKVNPPVANFTANITSGPAPLSVNFTDTSTGSPTSWTWSFGDGNTSAEQNPSHIYEAAGTFNVTLTAANAGGSDTVVRVGYINVTGEGPVADFTGTNLSGDSPLLVKFTDTSTGNPETWNWSFGDGEYSDEQNPLHEYIIGQTYTVSLTASNTNGTSTEIKPDFISVACPYSCDVTLTNSPYIEFGIDRMRCPEDHDGAWWDATCLNNAVIRWSRAGQSSSFYSTLSPWMWKRSACCPDPGYSWAFNSPANKPIYIAGLYNSQVIRDGKVFSHAVAAELLTNESPSNTAWESWNFFNYYKLNLSIGDEQIPVGNESEWTHVYIKSVDVFYQCGQQNGQQLREFYIAPNGTPFDHNWDWYTTNNLKRLALNTQLQEQKIPVDVNNLLKSIKTDNPFTINKWEFDETKKEIVIYAHDIKNERVINKYQKKPIGRYSIRIIHDTGFETTRKEVSDYLYDLRKNPDYQVNSVYMVTDRINDPPENIAEVWVYNSTPQNKELDNSMIQGWKIRVYPVDM